MSFPPSQSVTIVLGEGRQVSGLLMAPSDPRACYVMAHGAGAGMTHPFLTALAIGLAERGLATLRYQFPYMESGSRRPDSPQIAHAAVRAAVLKAAELLPGLPAFAGGKSFGGRMTSQAQALAPLEEVRGLIFLGFPLHPPGKPTDERAKHLFDVQIPMLFLQGTRDEFADLALLQNLGRQLGECATLNLLPEADHSFHVPARTGRKDPEIQVELMNVMTEWTDKIINRAGH